ncbi:TPA: TraR/DksA family transcriptional regulator [Escherichia coli]|nr:TraR/DksA family transcriptional regulator [Escherichia coli]
MPDNVDFIQEQQAELLERQINAARVKHCGASALVCEECDAPIRAASRRASYSYHQNDGLAHCAESSGR